MVGGKYIFRFSHPSMVGGFTFSPFLCLNFVVSPASEGGFWARKVAISRKDASSNREPQPMPQAEDIGFSLTHFDA